ncbi:MAG: hypothetical protein MI757_12650 [Pirellulales bacterium]|nr:hypothetical protein [Pirellulales bacterium]
MLLGRYLLALLIPLLLLASMAQCNQTSYPRDEAANALYKIGAILLLIMALLCGMWLWAMERFSPRDSDEDDPQIPAARRPTPRRDLR